MVWGDLLILLFISEWILLVRFVHTSCVTKTVIAKCNSVTELSDSYFNRSIEKFQDVQELVITNNYSELALHPTAFKYSKNLKKLRIEKSKIRRLFEGAFRDLPLETLVLHSNGLEEIYPGAFYNLPSLDHLFIINNSLKTIPRGVFKDLPRLEFLSLSKNQISSIEDFALENLPELRMLRLTHNKIDTIVIHRVVSHPEQLKTLSLYNNSLTSLTVFMLKKLTNLTALVLACNQISTIEANAFEQTPNLEILDLDRNKLKEVDGIFPLKGLINLHSLYLGNNELMFLSTSFLFGLPSLTQISLYENPWKCACLDSIHRILKNNGIIDECESVYSVGKRSMCVSSRDSNKYCNYRYDSELRDIYMNYKKTYPVNIYPVVCEKKS